MPAPLPEAGPVRTSRLLSAPTELLRFGTAAITSFQQSQASFRVVATLPQPLQSDATSSTVTPIKPSRTPRRLLVLDSSFNPPTKAHLRMALSAIAADGDQQDEGEADPSPSRLLLLLAVKNADKGAQPASFDHRLAMMCAFAEDLLGELDGLDMAGEGDVNEGAGLGDGCVVDIGLTTMPYFHDKSAVIAQDPFYAAASGLENEERSGAKRVRTDGESEQSSASTSTHHHQRPEQIFLAGFDTLVRILDPKYYNTQDGAALLEGQTPMQQALDPFFRRARLRIAIRADAEWGTREDQQKYVAAAREGGTLVKAGGKAAWLDRVDLVPGRLRNEEVVSSTLVRKAVAEKDWGTLRRMVTPGVSDWIIWFGLYGTGTSNPLGKR